MKWSGVEDCRREYSSIFCILTDSGSKLLSCFLKDVIFVENSPSRYYSLVLLSTGSTHLSYALPGIIHLPCDPLGSTHLSYALPGINPLSCGKQGSTHLSCSPPGITHLSCDPPGSTHLLCALPGINHMSVLWSTRLYSLVLRSSRYSFILWSTRYYSPVLWSTR